MAAIALSLLTLVVLSPDVRASVLREHKADDSFSSLLTSYGAASPSGETITGKTKFYKGGKKDAGGARDWRAISGSQDMSTVVAIAYDSLYVTVDYGDHWSQQGPRTTKYTDVAVSLSGQYIAATIGDDHIYLSSDHGTKWAKLAGMDKWTGITISGSGKSLAAVAGGFIQWGSQENGYIHVSNDYGATWTQVGPKEVWTDITSSKDFNYLAASVYKDGLYISSDSGVNWKKLQSSEKYISLTSSYDGSVVAAATDNGYLYISTDYGSTFSRRGMYQKWSSIASSRDGKTLIASQKGSGDPQKATEPNSLPLFMGYLYISHDTGKSWEKIALNVGDLYWQDVAVSADGMQVWAVATNDYIYASNINSTDSSAASCFAATEMVQLESGSDISIDKVRVGDRVLAYDVLKGFVYSSVLAVPHGENSVLEEFLVVTTASGADLKLTPKHLIGVTEDCGQSRSSRAESASFTLIRAEEVRFGHCLLTVDGVAAVTGIERTSGQGLYTIVTEAEYLVVNGVVTSPFAVSHGLGNFLYSGHRFIWSLFPELLSTKLFEKSIHFLSDIVMALSY